jgi:hypothetical protein
MRPASLRLGLVLEFLLAIVAVFVLWGQVGGQEHLDYMPWYWKLVPALGLAFAVVQATAAALEAENPWNRKTLGWLAAVAAWMVLTGAVTYYYHVTEPVEEEEEAAIESTLRL